MGSNMKTKAYCSTCGGECNHDVLFATKTDWSDDECQVYEHHDYEVLKCGGCDRVVMRRTSWFSEAPEPTVQFYPPPMFRRQPRWSLAFRLNPRTKFARQLLDEIYVGIQNGSTMIATMGVRALLEYVMIDSVGDHGTFTKNLTEFKNSGFISEKQLATLKEVLEAGHATMHRSYQPSDADLRTCVDIAESVLQTIYVHPGQAAALSKRVPKRK